MSISPHGHGHTECRVKSREHNPGEQSQLSVRNEQRLFDGLSQYAHDLTVDMTRGKYNNQHKQRVTSFTLGNMMSHRSPKIRGDIDSEKVRSLSYPTLLSQTTDH